jgi:hypothetical protein
VIIFSYQDTLLDAMMVSFFFGLSKLFLLLRDMFTKFVLVAKENLLGIYTSVHGISGCLSCLAVEVFSSVLLYIEFGVHFVISYSLTYCPSICYVRHPCQHDVVFVWLGLHYIHGDSFVWKFLLLVVGSVAMSYSS